MNRNRYLATVGFAMLVRRLRQELLYADNQELGRRLTKRSRVQLWSASWLEQQSQMVSDRTTPFWAEVSDKWLLGVARKLKPLTAQSELEPLFFINQIVAVSEPPNSLLAILLRVSSREVAKALLIKEEDYEWLKENYDIELTRARTWR